MVLASDQSSDVRRTMAVALRLCLLASSDDSLLTSLAEREHSVFTDYRSVATIQEVLVQPLGSQLDESCE